MPPEYWEFERRLSEAIWILERDSLAARINTNDMRHLLTCADDGRRVTIIRRACRMLSEGFVDGYLNPIRDRGVCPLGLCECETTTHFWTFMHPKTTQAVLSRKRKKNEVSYTSEEAKFTRERCIRGAAIVIMITPGVSNVCGVEIFEKSRVSPHRLQRNVRGVVDLIIGADSSSMVRYQGYMG